MPTTQSARTPATFGERFVRSRRLCLNRNRYHRSFSERYLIPSERRLATRSPRAYKKKELTNISFVECN